MEKEEKIATRQYIGKRIAQIRAEQGITQLDLAAKTGILRQHISRIETGKYSVGLDTLHVIATALGKKIDFV